MQNFSPSRQAVLELWPFLDAKKGYFCCFLGSKFKLNFLSIFHLIFLPEVKVLFYLGCQRKFQPYRTSGFQIIAVSSGQKGVFLLFFGSK
jgi:hypothetical protein